MSSVSVSTQNPSALNLMFPLRGLTMFYRKKHKYLECGVNSLTDPDKGIRFTASSPRLFILLLYPHEAEKDMSVPIHNEHNSVWFQRLP